MRSVVFSALLLGACVSRPVFVPTSGGKYGLASDNGVSLVADPRAWDGNPSDLEEYATPIAVEVHNGTDRALVLHLEGVQLEDNSGNVYRAWQIAGRKDTPPPSTRVAPSPAAPVPAPTPMTPPDAVVPPPTPIAPPSSAPAVEPTKAQYETIRYEIREDGRSNDTGAETALWSPDDDPGVQFARGPAAPPRSYSSPFSGGRGYSAPPRSYYAPRPYTPAPRSYAPPRSYSPPRSYAPYTPSRPYTGAPRAYTRPYGYGGYGGWNGWGYGYSYRPYWYGTPGFSPYWGLYGPGWGWGWGYTVYMGPNGYWGGSLPPERTDIVRLGLVDGTLQPGADVRGFVYFPELRADTQSIRLTVPVYDAKSNDEYARLSTQFSALNQK